MVGAALYFSKKSFYGLVEANMELDSFVVRQRDADERNSQEVSCIIKNNGNTIPSLLLKLEGCQGNYTAK